jgi:hypothetical protein
MELIRRLRSQPPLSTRARGGVVQQRVIDGQHREVALEVFG